MKWLILLFVGCAYTASVAKVSDSNWDELVDQAIDAARDDIIDKHLDSIKIPDLNKQIHASIIGIPFQISASIRGAVFKNVSSIKRTGGVTVLQDDVTGNITIATALGLGDFSVKADYLYLHVFGMSISGSLNAQCNSNSVEFSVSLITDKDDNCRAYVNWARISLFKDFSLELKPAGVFNWLVEHIISFVTNHFSSYILGFINKDLTPIINSVIKDIDICGYLPF